MKHFLVVLLAVGMSLFLSPDSRAQSLVADTVFNFNYHDAVNGMIVTDSGECILVGKMANDSLTPKNIWVRRMGTQGDSLVVVVWEKIFYPQNASRVGAVKWTQDGNFVICGSWNNTSMLMKMSPDGDSITTVLVPGTADTYFKDFTETENTNYVVLQVDVEEDLYSKMMGLTNNGSVLWEEEFFDRYYNSLTYYNADSFMVAGYEYHQEYQHLVYGCFNPENGSQYFSNFYQDNYGSNYSIINDTSTIYLGNSKEWLSNSSYVSQVVCMSPAGDLDWEVDFAGIGSEVIKDIHVYDDYLLTCSERFNAGKVVIGAITFDGVLFSVYNIPKPNPDVVAVDTWENYMFVTGRQFNGANGKDIFFMKFNLDSIFELISGQPEYILDKPVSLFPNPVSDLLHISVENPGVDEVTGIQLYNMAGHKMREISLNGDERHDLIVGDLPQGLYLVVLYFKDRLPVTEKVLVVH